MKVESFIDASPLISIYTNKACSSDINMQKGICYQQIQRHLPVRWTNGRMVGQMNHSVYCEERSRRCVYSMRREEGMNVWCVDIWEREGCEGEMEYVHISIIFPPSQVLGSGSAIDSLLIDREYLAHDHEDECGPDGSSWGRERGARIWYGIIYSTMTYEIPNAQKREFMFQSPYFYVLHSCRAGENKHSDSLIIRTYNYAFIIHHLHMLRQIIYT